MKPVLISSLLTLALPSFSQIRNDKTEIKRPQVFPITTTTTTPTTTVTSAPDPKIVASYNWWKYINPNNVNNLSTFSNINPVNYDTGLVAYSKRTALSLAGWINKNINIVQSTNGDSLIHLQPLVNLEQLLVSGFISDQGLMHIRGLKNLKEFQIAVTGSTNDYVTDKGASYLAQLTSLQKLYLYSCPKITDAGLQSLTTLTNLKELILLSSGITDNGIGSIKSFPMLEVLNISRTSGITDQSVDILINSIRNMKNFRKLIISFTNITSAGRQKLTDAGISFVY